MRNAITIIDPNAAPAPEAFSFAVDWVAFGAAGVVLLVTAVLVHRFLRRRLRASAVDLATDALVRRMKLGRKSRRGLAALARHAEGAVPAGVLLLNRTLLLGAAAKFRAGQPRKADVAAVEELLRRVGVAPVRVKG